MTTLKLTPESLLFFEEIKALEALHFSSTFVSKNIKYKNYTGSLEHIPVIKDYKIPSKYDHFSIPVRLYKPLLNTHLPLIIYAHGGGWIYGNLDSHDALCRRLAIRTNCSVLAVDYRLAPKYKFPYAINDFLTIYEWILSTKEDLRILKDSITFSGDSAGANIAASAVCRLIKEAKTLPHNLILIDPILNLSFAFDKINKFGSQLLLNQDILFSYREHYLNSHDNATDSLISPFFFDNLENFPKTLVINAEWDLLYIEGKQFTNKLSDKGVIATHCSFPGILHGFINCHGYIPEAEKALQLINNFLKN